MAPERPEYELSVEQELPAAADGAPRRARLTVRRSAGGTAQPADDAELARTLRDLVDRLARAADAAGVGSRNPSEARPDRPLSELLETYRPRQLELVELLHADGELTDAEFDLLRTHVAPAPAGSRPAADVSAAPVPPLRGSARPVEELLQAYQIESLRQAGAVRARRQISFEEYMSLKRHFSGGGSGPTESTPGA